LITRLASRFDSGMNFRHFWEVDPIDRDLAPGVPAQCRIDPPATASIFDCPSG
jgi:hypothetical protein